MTTKCSYECGRDVEYGAQYCVVCYIRFHTTILERAPQKIMFRLTPSPIEDIPDLVPSDEEYLPLIEQVVEAYDDIHGYINDIDEGVAIMDNVRAQALILDRRYRELYDQLPFWIQRRGYPWY